MTESLRNDIEADFKRKIESVVRGDDSFINPLLEQRERILLWSIPRNIPARDDKPGWYMSVSEVDRKVDKVSYVIKVVYRALKGGDKIGFPCSFLNLPDKEIDIRCRLRYWWEFKEPQTKPEKVELGVSYMRLLIGCHSLGISYRNPRNPKIRYDSSDESKREDLRSYGEFVSAFRFSYFSSVEKICLDEIYEIPPAIKLWNDNFNEHEDPPKVFNYVGRRRVIPSVEFLLAVYNECMNYPEDDCRFFFLAFDWVYRISEIITHNDTVVKTIVSLCRRLFDLEYGDIDEEVRRQVILLLDGMLVIEPLYRHATNGGDVILFWNKCLRKSLLDPSTYYDYPTLVNSFKVMGRNTQLDIHVKMLNLQ